MPYFPSSSHPPSKSRIQTDSLLHPSHNKRVSSNTRWTLRLRARILHSAKAYESRGWENNTFVINGRQDSVNLFPSTVQVVPIATRKKNCFFRQLNPLYLYIQGSISTWLFSPARLPIPQDVFNSTFETLYRMTQKSDFWLKLENFFLFPLFPLLLKITFFVKNYFFHIFKLCLYPCKVLYILYELCTEILCNYFCSQS